MPDREDFPLPDVINPPERRGICVPVPDDPVYMAVFAGLIQELTYWFNWQRDPLKRGKDAAHVWLEIFNNIDWQGGDCMGCCDDRIVMHRVTEDGDMEVSNDGGDTWTLDPADPRIIGTALHNSIVGTGEGKKCNAATNAIGNFKDAQASFGHSLTSATTVIGLVTAMAAEILILLFSVGTTAAVLVPVIISTAAGLFGVLEAGYNAEFTEEIWDKLTCDIFCTIGDDGQFTKSQLNDLEALVDTDFSDNVALTFQSILRGWGTLGLNNACISGVTATADCSDCDCPAGCVDPANIIVGTLIDQDDTSITIRCEYDAGYGQNMVVYGSYTVGAFCCFLAEIQVVEGSGVINYGYIDCDGGSHLASPVGNVFNNAQLGFNSNVSTIRLVFS